jgi:hypothetical protein
MAVAGRAFVPGLERAGWPVAHIGRVSHIEVEIVGELERENVARVLGEDAIEQFAGQFELPIAPCAKRSDMRFLSRVGVELRSGRMRCARLRR